MIHLQIIGKHICEVALKNHVSFRSRTPPIYSTGAKIWEICFTTEVSKQTRLCRCHNAIMEMRMRKHVKRFRCLQARLGRTPLSPSIGYISLIYIDDRDRCHVNINITRMGQDFVRRSLGSPKTREFLGGQGEEVGAGTGHSELFRSGLLP